VLRPYIILYLCGILPGEESSLAVPFPRASVNRREGLKMTKYWHHKGVEILERLGLDYVELRSTRKTPTSCVTGLGEFHVRAPTGIRKSAKAS
jgi:hypothetical protein